MANEQCRPVEVDGEVIIVRGEKPMTEDDQKFFAEIVRAAKAKFREDHVD